MIPKVLHVNETPSKFRSSYKVEQHEDTAAHAASVKPPFAADDHPDNSTKSVSSPLSQNKKKSIYEALGWDDVDELL